MQINDEIEIEYIACCQCRTAVKTRWTKRGMLGDYNENVLVADWVFHPSCWDILLRENPPNDLR